MEGISSIRYGTGTFDSRKLFIRLCALLQRKPVVILDQDPALCVEVLQNSVIKGTFIEHIFAVPAWRPIYSIESEDGPRWKELAQNCRQVLRTLPWKERLPGLVAKYTNELSAHDILDAEKVSRFTLKVLYELLFETRILPQDEDLFYLASLEWRKEIALRGRGLVGVKKEFCTRLHQIVAESKYSAGLQQHGDDPMLWLSVFAQPFIISPQINVSDIMVAAIDLLRAEEGRFAEAKERAAAGDLDFMSAVVQEAIRLQHPFPILERQLSKSMMIAGEKKEEGTQVFIVLDRFKHAQGYHPHLWLGKQSDNPYHGLIFGAGQRMCLGKAMAIELLREMLAAFLLRVSQDKIQPASGHLYSGRDNDNKQTLAASGYQILRFIYALGKSIAIGMRSWRVKKILSK